MGEKCTWTTTGRWWHPIRLSSLVKKAASLRKPESLRWWSQKCFVWMDPQYIDKVCIQNLFVERSGRLDDRNTPNAFEGCTNNQPHKCQLRLIKTPFHYLSKQNHMQHMTDSSTLHDHVEKELVVLWAGKAGSSFLQMVTAVRSWAAMTEFLPKDLLAAVIKSFIVPLSCTHSSTKLLHNASIETYASSYHLTLQLIISSHNQAYWIGNSWVFWHSPFFEAQLGKDQKLP